MPEDEKEKEPTKEEVLKAIDNAESSAVKLNKLGKDLTQKSQEAIDVLKPCRELVQCTPSDALPPEWGKRLGAFLAVKNEEVVQIVQISAAACTTCINTAVSLSSTYIPRVPVSPAIRIEIERNVNKVHSAVAKGPILKSIKDSLDRLGFKKVRKDIKTTYELLDDADDALGRGLSANSILLPLREAIAVTLEELLPRRQKQESSGNIHQKVLSIGGQCGLTGLSFIVLAENGKDIWKQLSDAKDKSFSREEIVKSFNTGLTFLDAFLKSLDASKLK